MNRRNFLQFAAVGLSLEAAIQDPELFMEEMTHIYVNGRKRKLPVNVKKGDVLSSGPPSKRLVPGMRQFSCKVTCT